jgi:hypothetical protein
METFEQLMVQLQGADPETVQRMAREKGSLPVRLAMLGLAASRKQESALWWGYPPGVFIGYKWNGPAMHDLVTGLAAYIRTLGYRAYLDVENLDQDADAYFQIPSYITSLQDCHFYLLLLTELSADMITARKRKTTWIFDEYQHALGLVNRGRLLLVPVLLEPAGLTDFFTAERVIDVTATPHDFSKLTRILTPNPIKLSETDVTELSATVAEFDELFLSEHWQASDDLLRRHSTLDHTFDHQFRQMLHAIYTASQERLDAVLPRLASVYGNQIVSHLYGGYCTQHGIPNRMTRS